MTVDYPKFNQVMTPMATGVPDVFLLLEQINTFLGIWYSVIDLENAPPPLFLSIKPTRIVCFQLAEAIIHLHCPTSTVYQLSSPMS